MAHPVLTYFDIPGGRGEPTRLAFHIGGIAFEDKRLKFPEFAALKATLPLGQLPTLQIGDTVITQSDAMLRYAGKLAGLYPTDAYQALLCDQIIHAVEDVNSKVSATFGLQGDALKAARTALADVQTGAIPKYLRWLQAQLQAQGGEYFADQRLTVADLKVFVWVRGLTSGNMDHIPTDLVAQVAPALLEHGKRVAAVPAIAAWYK